MKKKSYKLVKGVIATALAGIMVTSFAGCTTVKKAVLETQDNPLSLYDESGNPLVSNVFGFVLPPYLKCMSASGGTKGSNVYWRSSDRSQSQLWDITRG